MPEPAVRGIRWRANPSRLGWVFGTTGSDSTMETALNPEPPGDGGGGSVSGAQYWAVAAHVTVIIVMNWDVRNLSMEWGGGNTLERCYSPQHRCVNR